MDEYNTIFYFANLNVIGGIETFFYQIAKKYNDRDITIFIKSGNQKQIDRLRKYVRVKIYKGEKITCKKAFFNFNLDIIDNVEADEYIQILHGDYKKLQCKPNISPKINRYISVSEIVRQSYKELTGIDSKVIYNPYELLEEPKKVLFLVSATRLTPDKGKDRIIKLSNMFDEQNIPYIWLIFTDDNNAINNPNIIYMKPRLDIMDYIKRADYLVQLSNAEGYCYSIVEALSVGTPVITTDIDVIHEIGVNESNGFIVDFDLSNIDVQEIYNKKFDFKYAPLEDKWDEEILNIKSTYKEELKMKYKVEALPIWKEKNITCIDLGNRVPKDNEQWEVDKFRLDVLLGDNPFKQPFVKVVEEIKENYEAADFDNRSGIVDEVKKQLDNALEKGAGISKLMIGKEKETSKKDTKSTTKKKPAKKEN